MSDKRFDRLWIISELFPPEETSTGYIMGEIAKVMSSKYDVGVICGPEVYDSSKSLASSNELVDGYNFIVYRVPCVRENKNRKLSRIKKFLLISWRLYRVARKQINDGDRVLMVTNPFPLILLMAYLRRKRKYTLSLLVHDIAPEGLFTDMTIPHVVYKIVEKLFKWAYSSTDLLISIGRDMSEILSIKCEVPVNSSKICLIENWADTENIKPADNHNDSKIVIQYAGNIGNAQGVGDFVDVLYESQTDNVCFSVWGTGSAVNAIKKKVQTLKMSDMVSFNGPYRRSEQNDVLNSCDIALVRLVKGMYGLGVPSKAYNIMAAGKPILYIGERGTEIWRVIDENHNGFCFEPEDNCGLVNFLSSLSHTPREILIEMGHISRRVAMQKYSKKVILNKFLDQI